MVVAISVAHVGMFGGQGAEFDSDGSLSALIDRIGVAHGQLREQQLEQVMRLWRSYRQNLLAYLEALREDLRRTGPVT